MLFVLPFFVLLIILIFTKNNFYALVSGLLCSFFVYTYTHKVSLLFFFTLVLPKLAIDIVSPSGGYFYPLAFLILVAWVLFIFDELRILDSYAILLSHFIFKINKKIFDLLIVFSPLLFFLDDYLAMMGIKNFFMPILKSEEANKKELAFYAVNLAGPGSVLFFLSTWVALIMGQINSIKQYIPDWVDKSNIFIFSESRKYFFYPIIMYLFSILYIFFKSKRNFSFIEYKKEQKILWEDIGIFLLLPFGIFCSFIYKIFYLSVLWYELDAALVMFEGIIISIVLILFFLFLCKSITYRFVINTFIKVIEDNKKIIITLLFCWLFSKITILCIDLNVNLSLPNSLIFLYPIFYFILSLFIALILGSEWGTLSIVIVLLVFAKDYFYFGILLGAVVSGAIAGAQLSPVSNTNITVSAIMGVDAFEAYKYRIKYTLLVTIFTLISYFLIGLYYK